LGALLAVAGLTPTDQIFAGFGHPAVVTVAAVLVLSRGMLNAGVVDTIAQSLGRVGNQPMIQVATLTGVVALCSGFMNNVGALALLMPVAIWMSRQSSRPPSLLLMPLAFGSLLGGTITLIGTPPNIIIAAYRAQTGAPPFGMFEFFPVGIGITLVGVLFISLLGWRLTPKREKQGTPEELFQIGDYISEVRVTEHSKVLGQTLHDLLSLMESESDVTIVGLFRGKQRHMAPSMYAVLQAGDILMVETDPESLKGMIDAAGLELAESGDIGKGDLGADDVSIIEAIVALNPCSLDVRQPTSICAHVMA
jgi:di/tricarboxylate transporter